MSEQNYSQNNGETSNGSYVTIKATPEQAQRLAELGAISATQAQQAKEAGALLVRIPAGLVAEFQQGQASGLPDSQDVIGTVAGQKSVSLDEEAELDKLANWLEGAGMNAPARIFLATNRPLSFMGSQVLLAAQPVSRLAFGQADPTGHWSRLLEKRVNVDRLIGKLEQLEADRKLARKQGKNRRQGA